jgi:hypothetical protein
MKADVDRIAKRKRDADSARRYRQRCTRKQAIYRVTAHQGRTLDLLIGKGLLIEDRETGSRRRRFRKRAPQRAVSTGRQSVRQLS